jgi:hypothetical protein
MYELLLFYDFIIPLNVDVHMKNISVNFMVSEFKILMWHCPTGGSGDVTTIIRKISSSSLF